ncbi:MAG TPA: ABC transporter permease [Lentimicrobium sp.]|nr:ABC transporter permease [Lentimicrobium sp.]
MERVKRYLKLLRESYIFALKAIVVNKVRTILSLSGITIGIFSIISVFTVFDSIKSMITESVSSLGSNVLYVQKWPWAFSSDYPWWEYMKRPETRLSELVEIQKRSQASQSAAYMVSTMRKVKHKNLAMTGTIVAVSHDYPEVATVELASGRYFSFDESAGGRPVAIIGNEIAASLYGATDPIGQKIKVFSRNLEIIGVLKKEGMTVFSNSSDYYVMMPVQFARQFIDLKSDNIGAALMVKAKPMVTNEELADELKGIMRSVRKLKPGTKDNFAINKSDIVTQTFEGLFSVINIVGWIIGGFSLLVGGFGIANIMFVSVKERTPQIGIQKSMGAKNSFILQQFLFESVFLSLFGGIVGLLLIFLITMVLTYGFDMRLVLTFGNIMLGITVSAVIGLVSGFIPALSASRLDPVEAMRSSF